MTNHLQSYCSEHLKQSGPKIIQLEPVVQPLDLLLSFLFYTSYFEALILNLCPQHGQ